jgi:predicted transposase/invertase (TIGR01784 family)
MGIKKEELQDLQLVNLELQREFLEDKLGILDVRVKLKDGTDIDIEIQLSYTKYMAERSLYIIGVKCTHPI